jgi:uncharacterized cupredoxin-like copper-binding protein
MPATIERKGHEMKSILLLAVFLVVPPAHAHGDKKHMQAAPDTAEQTVWGIAGKPAQVIRTITLELSDAMRFTPDSLSVEEGDTVRFVIRNQGRMLHEMVIGTPAELASHAALMARFPNMAHDEAYMAHVASGKAGEIVWHFNRAGSFEFACLIAGHYEAGMRGTINVTPKQGAAK